MIRTATALVVGFSCAVASASTSVLYDGSLGTTPAAQGSLSYFSTPGGTVTTASGSTRFSSMSDSSIRGGFSTHAPILNTPVNPLLPSFPASGFDVQVDVALNAEAHTSNHRAGLSLIVLNANGRGIELGFWSNSIWAQSGADFQRAESAGVPTSPLVSYVLSLSEANGGSYTLRAFETVVLTGPLRDYSSFGVPYSLPNYIFLGDNTSSASGDFSFSHLSVTVPEPATLGLAALLLPLLARRRA